MHADRENRVYADPGPQDQQPGHRRLPRRPAAAEDPLLGDGRRGAGIGRVQLAQKRGVDLARDGRRRPRRAEREGRVVCKCFSLTEPYIRRKIRELNLHTIPDIINAIKAGGACMACHHVPGGLQDLLNETGGRAAAMPNVPRSSSGLPSRPRPEEYDLPYQFRRRSKRPSTTSSGPCSRARGATWRSSTSRSSWSSAGCGGLFRLRGPTRR